MKKLVWTLSWLMVLLPKMCFSEDSNLEKAVQKLEDENKQLNDRMKELKDNVVKLWSQNIMMQFAMEEGLRSEGSSGIVQVRTNTKGTSSYHSPDHIDKAPASIHDHSDYHNTLGMGEAVVVLNGYRFRTRHNDFKTVMPSRSDGSLFATEEIPRPGVPPEILKEKTVEGQEKVMQLYFRAFKEQNKSIADYRPYFRPVICYLEGAWLLGDEFIDPSQSDRHTLDATSWTDLYEKARYISYTGAEDLGQNIAFLPTSVISVNETTGRPEIAQFNYRILCYPSKRDIPTSYLKQQDDLANRAATQKTKEQVFETRACRFKLSEYDTDRYTRYTFLDKLMETIPGMNNHINHSMNEEAFGLDLYNYDYPTKTTRLNTAYYHRMFKAVKRNTGDIFSVYRGFSDEFLYVAETNQSRVAPMKYTYCYSRRNCSTRVSRFTYAIPLEVVYQTPLQRWNPYNLTIRDFRLVRANGRTGSKTDPSKAYNGTSGLVYYYLTPETFYGGDSADVKDAADTVQGSVGVLDQEGNIRITVASGIKIITPKIKGVGSVRTRYPIHPIRQEGSANYKALAAMLKITTMQTAQMSPATSGTNYNIEMAATSLYGAHTHEFDITSQEYDNIQKGSILPVSTSEANGHSHKLEIWINPSTKIFEYKTCNGENECTDKHPKQLSIVSGPGIE